MGKGKSPKKQVTYEGIPEEEQKIRKQQNWDIYNKNIIKEIKSQRSKIRKFLGLIAAGQNKLTAFRDTFPESEKWSKTKIWRYVNAIMLRYATSDVLQSYRKQWLAGLEQKKVDMLILIEQEMIFNDNVTARDKLRAIETFAKLAGFTAPAPTVIQQINVKENNEKELLTIFGMDKSENMIDNNSEVVDAEIIDNNDFNLDIENDE